MKINSSKLIILKILTHLNHHMLGKTVEFVEALSAMFAFEVTGSFHDALDEPRVVRDIASWPDPSGILNKTP